jgi:hypothetical protein
MPGAAHDLALLFPGRVGDDDLEHEPVHLGFRQRVGALLLDGVLGSQDQERVLQEIGDLADGDLALLHGLQQRAVHLGGCPVDLVRQHDIGEDGPLAGGENPLVRVVDQGADEVGGQQVRRELDALEARVDQLGQALDHLGLGESRHALDEDVAVAQQGDQDPLFSCRATRLIRTT